MLNGASWLSLSSSFEFRQGTVGLHRPHHRRGPDPRHDTGSVTVTSPGAVGSPTIISVRLVVTSE
jgi:hypothetical protein